MPRQLDNILWPLCVAALLALPGCLDQLVPVPNTDPAPADDGAVGPPGPSEPGADDPIPPIPVDTTVFQVTGLDPDRGPVEGLVAVTIEGGGFSEPMQVFFGESQALETFVVHEGMLLAYAPPRPPGLVDVMVMNLASGQTFTLEGGFLYENPLELLALEPASGHVLGGEPVVVRGEGFSPETTVLFGGRKAIGVLVVDEETLHCVTPEGDQVGPVDVALASDKGNHVAAAAWTYVAPPGITAISPPATVVGAPATVDVLGDGFVAPVSVMVGGAPLADVEVLSPTHLAGTVAAASEPGLVDVVVTTAEGLAVAPEAFAFLDEDAAGLELVGLYPTAGATHGGDAVTLTVVGLQGASGVSVGFGDAPAELLSVAPSGHAVVASAPAVDEPGPVDVTLTQGGETLTLEAAFTYEVHPQVVEVLPNHGDVAGGVAVTLHGSGFSPGAQVRIGALPAAGVVVVDDQTITATTPPGTAGLANVRVTVDGDEDVLIGGFAFTDGLDLWTLDPGAGAMAGGTLVDVAGSGFAPGMEVRFGDLAATEVDVLSPTHLRLRTPPGDIGKVDVTATVAGVASVVQPSGFIYFDPAGSFGGTWGAPVARTVNVAVKEWGTLQGIPGALVVLGSEPYTEHVGMTDANGHITFSGFDLAGAQLVTAGKPGFTTSSLVAFDAENVTLLVGEIPPCSNPDIDCGSESAIYTGQVIGSFKGIQTPWGDCADVVGTEGTPAGLCEPCAADEDCREEHRCTDLLEAGSFCTSECAESWDCPYGFDCVPMTGAPPQCVPTAGTPTVVCLASTNPQFPASPDPDGNFQIYVPLGEFAVGCWSGIQRFGQFEPQMFGVQRHAFAGQDGAEVSGQVKLTHPVARTIEIEVDRPALGVSEETEKTEARISLVLGSDGAFELPGDHTAQGRAPHVRKVLNGLTGELWDARYTVELTAVTQEEPLAASIFWERDVEDFVADHAWRLDGEDWEPIPTGLDETVRAVAATDSGILAVGDAGQIVRDVGEAFATQQANTDVDLLGVASLGSGPAIAVGREGVALHYDGLSWTPLATGVDADVEAVWMAAADDAWAVAGAAVLHFDGVTWTQVFEAPAPLHAVWGDGAGAVWVAGDDATLARHDEAGWTLLAPDTDATLRALWGSGPDDLIAVGDDGAVLRYSSAGLQLLDTPVAADLHGVWGYGADDVWAVGARGAILHWDGATWADDSRPGHLSTFYAAAGGPDGRVWAMGAREIVLGPMLAIPVGVSPADGASLQDAISWSTAPEVRPADLAAVYIQSSKQCSIDYCGTPATMTLLNDLWLVYAEGGVDRIDLPQSGNVPESTGVGPGTKGMAIWRVRFDGAFDFDNASYLDFWEYGVPWKAWSFNETMVNVQ